MKKPINRRLLLVVVMPLLAISLILGTVFAQSKQATPKPQNQDQTQKELTDAVKQLLLLMDTDKNGKISKQEWMNFMSAEFDRLDKDKSGDLTQGARGVQVSNEDLCICREVSSAHW